MTPVEFKLVRDVLGLRKDQDISELFQVDQRTVRRWTAGAPIPAAVAHCMNAWWRLKAAGLVWRPVLTQAPNE